MPKKSKKETELKNNNLKSSKKVELKKETALPNEKSTPLKSSDKQTQAKEQPKEPNLNMTDSKTEQPEKKQAAQSKSEGLKEQKTPVTPSKKSYKVVWLVIILVLVVIIGALVTVGIGIYRFNWHDRYTNKIIQIIPYPIALVNWQIVRFSDFQQDVKTLDHFYQKQKELGQGNSVNYTEADIKKEVLTRLIEDVLVAQEAAKRNIVVSKADVDNEFDAIVKQAGSQAELEKTLQELYSWTVDQFKDKVLTKFLLGKKLEQAIDSEPAVDSETKAKAEAVLAKVKAGEKSFEDLAKEFSEDMSASQGGDLGYVRKGDMVLEFENAAFALEVGKVSDLVKTQYGYHIIKLLEKVKDAQDPTIEVLHVEHILIRFPTLEQWLTTKEAQAKIYRFIKT